MIKPEMVPMEAIAELRAFLNSCDCDDCVSVAIAAALNAWPGMRKDWTSAFADEVALILPITQTQEDGDE